MFVAGGVGQSDSRTGRDGGPCEGTHGCHGEICSPQLQENILDSQRYSLFGPRVIHCVNLYFIYRQGCAHTELVGGGGWTNITIS